MSSLRQWKLAICRSHFNELASSPDETQWNPGRFEDHHPGFRYTSSRLLAGRVHLVGRDDELVKVKLLLDRIEDVLQFLNDVADSALEHALAKSQTVGRRLMNEDELVSLEKRMKRRLRPARRGRPRKRGTGNAADRYVGN